MLNKVSHSFNNYQTLHNQKKVRNNYPLIKADTVAFKTTTRPQPNINFTGITKAIKKKLYKKLEDIQILVNKHDNCIAGNLPEEWLNKIPKNKINEVSKDIQADFALAASDLLKPFEGVSLDDYNYDIRIDYDCQYDETFIRLFSKYGSSAFQLDEEIDLAGYTIQSALKRNGIIEPNENIHFNILGVGKNAITYSLNVKDQKYVFKVYHEFYKDIQNNPSISNSINIDSHGILPEANRAFFLQNHAKNNNYAQPIWADLKANYMITRFLDPETLKMPKTVISKEEVGIIATDDVSANFIKESDNAYNKRVKDITNKDKIEYTIDYGGIEIENNLLATNKSARYVHSVIKRSSSQDNWTKKWDELYNQSQDNKIPNSKDIMLGLTDFLQYLPEKDVPRRLQIILALARKDIKVDQTLAHTMLNILCNPERKFNSTQRVSMMDQLEYGATDNLKESLIKNFKHFNNAGLALNLYNLVYVLPTINATKILDYHIDDLKPEEQHIASKMVTKMKQYLKI